MPRRDPQKAFVSLNKHSEKASREFQAVYMALHLEATECHTQVNISMNTLHHFFTIKREQ